MMDEYACEECGIPVLRYPSRVRGRVFCSVDCFGAYQKGKPRYNRRNRVEMECLQCNKLFYKRPCEVGKYNFCSSICSVAWQKVNNPKGNAHVQYDRVELTCHGCGKIYERTRSQAVKNKNSYCSVTCSQAASRGKKCKNPKRITRDCAWCGIELSLVPSLVRRNNFCSFDCRGHWYSENYSGTNSPQYIDGKAPKRKTGVGWHNIRRLVRERDKKCVVCGDNGKMLVVHHLKARRHWKTVEESNTLANLITLCQSCHGKVTTNKDVFPAGEEWNRAKVYADSLARQ